MEYFKDKGGRFQSTGIPGMGRTPVLKMIGGLVPILVIGVIYITTSSRTGMKPEQMYPFYIAGGIVVLSLALSMFLRSRGMGSGITVDQMSGTISFKRPGSGSRFQMPLAELDEITLLIMGEASSYGATGGRTGATLSIKTRAGQSHMLAFGRDPVRMRQLADELSIITSLSVKEERKQS